MAISRRKFISGLMGAGLTGGMAHLWAQDTPFPEACFIRSVKIPAPAGWAGRRALFISDIHYDNYFGANEAKALNAIVLRAQPDLVLMGGDLAQTPETDLTEFFRYWAPGCPTFFSPGNHDIRGDLGGSILGQAREGGMTVLCNNRETWNGLALVGLPSALQARQNRALLRAPGLKLVLGHEPDVWDRYREPDLVHLAGHTHGGQIRVFDRPLTLPTLGRKYPLGDFAREGNSRLIVSAGLGCVDVRARINCPPEIIQLDFA